MIVPFGTGVGEATRAVKTTVKVADKTDDFASDIRNATGSYEIVYKSGKNYIGKSGLDIAIDFAKRYAKTDDIVTDIRWKSAHDIGYAFIDEY